MDIEEQYGKRIRPRMREMFNLLAFDAGSKDKRQQIQFLTEKTFYNSIIPYLFTKLRQILLYLKRIKNEVLIFLIIFKVSYGKKKPFET